MLRNCVQKLLPSVHSSNCNHIGGASKRCLVADTHCNTAVDRNVEQSNQNFRYYSQNEQMEKYKALLAFGKGERRKEGRNST